MDSIVMLDLDIRKALANKEAVVGVFLDIEKAYDMLWKEGLGLKLYDDGIRGRMLNWINNFLRDRTIQVRVGGALSSEEVVTNGTPQGPVLFNIMINDFFCRLGQGFGVSLLADDRAIWKRGRNLDHIYKQLQKALEHIETWTEEWGFKISVAKSKYVVFGYKRKTSKLALRLYKRSIERVKTLTFLGVWLEEKITWREHIKRVVAKCEKVINVLRCLVGTDWGASRETLMMIYRAAIRSSIDYGCIVYGAAAPTVLKQVEVVQAKALWICGGAFRTSPIQALLVEMGETPLEIRKEQAESELLG